MSDPAVQSNLRAASKRIARRALGEKVHEITFHPVVSASSHPVVEVRAVTAAGRECRLLAKDTDPQAVAPVARGVKPRFVADPDRERVVYTRVLSAADLGTPRLLGVAGGRWLFLEYVAARPLDQVGDFQHWEAAAAWVARLHSDFPAGQLAPGVRRSLLSIDRAWLMRWARRAVRFLERRDGVPADRLRVLRRAAASYSRVAERVLGWPASLTHGDFFPANILVAGADRAAGRICPVDWEQAGLGPGLLDLAAVTAGKWSDEQRAALAAAYYRALPARGRPTERDFRNVFDWCRLHVAVQAIGWADGWTPPAHQAHDWLGDVAGLADRLGL